jgi:hypothetical protein
MSRFLALGGVTLLVGCAAAPQPGSTTQPAASPDTASITERLENNWTRCLDQSYRVTRTRTPDKNAAVETAFQACSSEERDLVSLPHGDLLMPHLRSEVKQMLVEGTLVPPEGGWE